jgi:transmembrane sensor
MRMNSNDEKVRAAIADQAGEWFVANGETSLDARDAAALAAWLMTSPVHVEEFLGVSAIARDLKAAGTHPEYSVEAILARARVEGGTVVRSLESPAIPRAGGQPPRRWLAAAFGVAVCAVLSLGLLFNWNARLFEHPSAPVVTELHFETRHGEQMTRRLADDSLLHLNTDSAVTIRYSETQRLVTLYSGQADFEVAHDADRAFRVLAGSAEILDIGTQFDVRLERDSTVVTVVEGRIAVEPSTMQDKHGTNSSQNHPQSPLQLGPDQQLRVTQGEWPAVPIAVDAQRTTSWVRREIVFDHEPLEQVAAEYSRYAPKSIEITTPALRNLKITGSFATDDPDAFIAFLRSLKGVRVQVTATQIRVSGN